MIFIFRVMVIFVLQIVNFRYIFHDNSKNKNLKIDFSFDNKKFDILSVVILSARHFVSRHHVPQPHILGWEKANLFLNLVQINEI